MGLGEPGGWNGPEQVLEPGSFHNSVGPPDTESLALQPGRGHGPECRPSQDRSLRDTAAFLCSPAANAGVDQ